MSENLPSADELRALADEIEDSEGDNNDRINDLIDLLSPFDNSCSIKNTDTDGKYVFAVETTNHLRDRKGVNGLRDSDEFEIGAVQWGDTLEYIDSGVELRIYDTEVYDD